MSRKPTYEELKARVEKLENVEYHLRELEERLQDKVTLWDILLEQSRDGITVLDRDGKVYAANKRTAEMLGYTAEEILQLHVWDWDCTYTKEQILEMIQAVDESGDHFETQYRRKDGTVIDVELSNNGAFYNGKKLVFCVSRDVTERKRMEETLRKNEKKYRELSIVDDLTSLYNSRHFVNHLKMETDRAERYNQSLTLLFFDLDDFKRYNDTYGHVEGNHVLKRLGQIIKENLRQMDSAFRYGGEEFAILMPMTDIDGAVAFAERLGTGLHNEVFTPVPGRDIHITVSMGIARYIPNEDLKTFVKRADHLMYEAKKDGKNRVYAESVPERI